MKKIIILLLLNVTLLFSGEKEVVKQLENALFTQNYKKMAHQYYEMKKKQQELGHIYNNISKVKRDIMLKEANVNALLADIAALPMVEVLTLNQSALGLQTEQSINDLKVRSEELQVKDINIILDNNK